MTMRNLLWTINEFGMRRRPSVIKVNQLLNLIFPAAEMPRLFMSSRHRLPLLTPVANVSQSP